MPGVPAAVTDVATRAKTVFFVQVMSLPERVQRVIAGRPVRVEGNELALQAQLMLRLQKIAREPATETLPREQGRVAMTRQGRIAGGRQPIGEVHERTVPGADGGQLPARLYVPQPLVGGGPGPLVVFFHGGGMVNGDLDSHDAVCRFLAEQADVRVLSVGYRLAPEHPFPAGVDDAWAAYQWVSDHGADVGADPQRLAVAGDSAGGHLAAVTAIRAAQEGRDLAFQLLIYPMTELCGDHRSRHLFADGYYLTRAFIEQAEDHYLAGGDPADPRGSVLHADVPAALAPAYLCTAGFDPLRDEGDAYAAKLREAGVPVEHERFTDHVHGFANLLAVEGPAKDYMHRVAAALKAALAGG
jgi:acetyl esterase